MGTIQQDIHDLHSALDFFAGYATQEEVVPADYEVGLHHAGWIKLTEALNYARQQIGSRLRPTQIATLPAQYRAAAVLWFVHTLSNRKGDALARIWTSLQTYPAEALVGKFPNASAISDWVNADAPPWGTPKARPGTDAAPHLLNRFGVEEGAGVVLITAMGSRISSSEALNLAAHLEIAAAHTGGSPCPFEEFLQAAEANLGHAPSATAAAAIKPKQTRKARKKRAAAANDKKGTPHPEPLDGSPAGS